MANLAKVFISTSVSPIAGLLRLNFSHLIEGAIF